MEWLGLGIAVLALYCAVAFGKVNTILPAAGPITFVLGGLVLPVGVTLIAYIWIRFTWWAAILSFLAVSILVGMTLSRANLHVHYNLSLLYGTLSTAAAALLWLI